MAVPADHGQVVPGIVGGITIDVVFFDWMSRFLADAAGMPVRHHEAIRQPARNAPALFQVTSIPRLKIRAPAS
jgi:hypothetical protein